MLTWSNHPLDSLKTQNYKLKHSRLLTCYSALLYVLAIFRSKKSVGPTDVLNMIRLSPTERLESLRDNRDFVELAPLLKNSWTNMNNFWKQPVLVRRSLWSALWTRSWAVITWKLPTSSVTWCSMHLTILATEIDFIG